MKGFTFLLFFLLSACCSYSQVRGVVFDSRSKAPIPYVNIWVEDENTGTTSDHSGTFFLKDSISGKPLVFSAVGYERKKITATEGEMAIPMEPVVYALPEVVIRPQNKRSIVIGHFKRSHISLLTGTGYFPGSSATPEIFARFFPYHAKYENTRIEYIRFVTYSEIESTINMRFFSVSENGEPGQDLLNDNLIIHVKKGFRNNRITDFKGKQLQIPVDGFFIALEFMILKENEYYYKKINFEPTNTKIPAFFFMPLVGVIDSKTSDNSWVYCKGKWSKDLGKRWHEMNQPDKNHVLAIEIKLSN